jgi:hypothetical protein
MLHLHASEARAGIKQPEAKMINQTYSYRYYYGSLSARGVEAGVGCLRVIV